jgi:hypothetical protein
MTVSSTDRLREIRERLAKATPGPWKHQIWTTRGDCRRPDAALHVVEGPPPSLRFEDAQLIANAPADLAFLLGEVSRLDAENAELRAALEQHDTVGRFERMLDSGDPPGNPAIPAHPSSSE